MILVIENYLITYDFVIINYHKKENIMEKLDYKKAYKDLYMPKTKPMLIEVPPITYVMVEGSGNPNTSIEYKQAIEVLYSISYAIKMSKMKGNQPEGYFEYVVPPLEGLWWGDDGYFDGVNIIDKDKFHFKSMIRLPEFVTQEYFEQVKEELSMKKPDIDYSKAQYFVYDEGLCVQVMHKGSFDEEATSVAKINQFISENHLEHNMSDERFHHEIYLSDFRKTKTENLKTVIRHPVKRQ